MSATLSDIRTKVRRITGLANPNQLSDANIDFAVNTFYKWDLPEQLKLLDLKSTYQFYTEPNQEAYAFPKNDYTLVQPRISVNGYETQWFQDKTIFYRTYPTLDVNQILTQADGSPGPYSALATSQPLLKGYTNGLGTIVSNVIVATLDSSGDQMVIRDDGAGGFLDENGNTIVGASVNYTTGAITAIFPSNTQSGANVIATYYSFSTTRPTSVLFVEDTFFFRPIPDQAYIVDMTVYVNPTALVGQSDNPALNSMWQLLAFGAAQKIFIDLGKLDQAAAYQPYLDEQMDLVRRRTLNQMDVQRVATLYSAQLTGQYSNNNYWW